jgi:hypothetical protein
MTWLETRAWLNEHRWQLCRQAAELYPDAGRVAGTALLADPGWLPPAPVPLEELRLEWDDQPARWPVTAGEPRYSDTMRELAPPRVFANRLCYGWRGIDEAKRTMAFGPVPYFANIDIGEAVAHEYAHAVRNGATDLPMRRAVGDPLDLTRRPVPVAISTLVLRRDGEQTRMLLHWRDPAKVAMNGGLYQVAPVGVFQPSDDREWNVLNDFDLWRGIQREMAEELLGASEEYGSDTAPIDYAAWDFARKLDAARRSGDLVVQWLGAGIDPLTLVCDLLCRVTIAAPVFDDVLAGLVTENDEGVTTTVPFDAATVERYSTRESMQPAGAALLRLASSM